MNAIQRIMAISKLYNKHYNEWFYVFGKEDKRMKFRKKIIYPSAI